MSDFDLLMEFTDRVRPIEDDQRLKELGICPDGALGYFSTGMLGELLDFCRENPQFHIVSSVEGAIVNRLVYGALFYEIAEGDRDPWLTCPDYEIPTSN